MLELQTGIILLIMPTIVLTLPYDTRLVNVKGVNVERVKRFATNCSTWTSWINTNTPNATNPTDHDFLTTDEMESFCPKRFGGNVTKMLCLDDKLGLFNGTREDEDHVFIFRCLNITEGVVCEPKRPKIDTCPNVAVKYFCSCTPTTPIFMKPNNPTSNTRKSTTTTTTMSSSVSYMMLFPFSTPKQTKSTVALPVVQHRLFTSTPRNTRLAADSGREEIGWSLSNDDSSHSEEETEMMYNKLTHTMLVYHDVPTLAALATLIILCCIIIACVCRLQKQSSIGPISKPMGTGHLF